jgi:hypothetical protein
LSERSAASAYLRVANRAEVADTGGELANAGLSHPPSRSSFRDLA